MNQDVKAIEYPAGATVVLQGAKNEGFFYIVQEGTLAIQSKYEFDEKELSRFQKGDSFGLVSALTKNPFLATIVSLNKSRVLRIKLNQLGTYLKSRRDICLKMISMYTIELRALDKYLARINDQTEWDNKPEKMYQDSSIYEALGEPAMASYALYQFIDWVKKNPTSPGSGLLEKAKQLYANLPPTRPKPESGTEVTYEANEIIFLENQPSDCFYVIKSGSVKITKLVKNHEFILGILGPGELFGEMSLVDDQPRFASALMSKPGKLMRLNKQTFFEQVGEQVLQKIFTSLARRIYVAHKRLAVLRIPDATARLYLYLESLVKEMVMRNPDLVEQQEFSFNFTFHELKKMTGLVKVSDKRVATFINDPNLQIEDGKITIFSQKVLRDSILKSTTKMRQSLRKMSM